MYDTNIYSIIITVTQSIRHIWSTHTPGPGVATGAFVVGLLSPDPPHLYIATYVSVVTACESSRPNDLR